MYLKELLQYKDVVVQCHDNPDADAIASGWGLYDFFVKNKVPVRFIYGGKFAIQKSNLVLMKDTFSIPIEYVTELKTKPDLLITVDCQYGEGNVQKFEANNIAVIDHHRISGDLPKLNEIRSNIGSCSTIVWDMLKKEGIDANDNPDLATAFYYGLLTDTNWLVELSHPLDRDLCDVLKYKKSCITLFRNSNLSLEELKIAGEAMENCAYSEKYLYGYVESKPCDPNILGIISDAFLEVHAVNSCLVYSILPFGVKISVRSCVKEVKANELAEYLTENTGSGGGHLDKAGGLLEKKALKKLGVEYTSEGIANYLHGLMDRYFEETEIIFPADYKVDLSQFDLYRKNRYKLGYVDATELAPIGTVTSIRTLEGDVDVIIEDGVYIMIGIDGEVYPIRKSTFEKAYEPSDEPYIFPGEYAPSIRDARTGEPFSVVTYAKSCISTGNSLVYAKKLDHRLKIFSQWDDEKYYLGKPGDYLVSQFEEASDLNVVAGYIFAQTYTKSPDQ